MNEGAPQSNPDEVPSLEQQVESVYTPDDHLAMEQMDLSVAAQKARNLGLETPQDEAKGPLDVMRDIEIKNDITQARLEHDINSPDELPKENDDGSVSGDDALMSLHVKPNDYKADDLRRLMKAVWDEEKLPPPDGPDGRGSDGGKI